jgi:hypothetical protein
MGRGPAVQVEDVFRDANEQVAAKARALEYRTPIPFLCECSDPRCFIHKNAAPSDAVLLG